MQKSFTDDHAVVSANGRSTQLAISEAEEPTVLLRVRRRGAITSSSILRVELDAALAAASALADVDLGENVCDDTFQRRSSTSATTATFRRIEPLTKEDHHQTFNGSNARRSSLSSSLKRRLVLDAVLLEEGLEDGPKNEKRRRVTLQLLETPKEIERHQPRQFNPYAILTPEQRAVDDSLSQVFEGSLSLEKHLQFLESAFCISRIEINNDDNGNHLSQFWPWCYSGGGMGTCLHAAAVWNEAYLAKELLGRILLRLSITQQNDFLNDMLLLSLNAEGLNPIEVARLSGNTEVEMVFESFAERFPHVESSAEMDSSRIVYDLYSLVPENMSKSETKEELLNSPLVLDCELHNECLGFWDASTGDLVLAPNRGVENLGVEYNDDVDSNDEDWNGNDYPEEDEDWSVASSEEDIYPRRVAQRFTDCEYDDDNSSNYDPSYGAIYGQSDGLYDYDGHC